MVETFSFFEEGIKSYIEQSISKYSETPEIIFKRDFDNILLNPLFINDLSLFKNLIQKNKLKCEIWKSLGDTFLQKLNNISRNLKEAVKNVENKILKYKERIKKNNIYIQQLEDLIKDRQRKINKNINEDKKNSYEKEENIPLEENNENDNKEKDDLSDVKLEEYNSKKNAELIIKIQRYNEKIKEGKKSLEHNGSRIRRNKKKIIKGKINLLKFQILILTVDILINEINYNNKDDELNNEDNIKENNYKLLNNYINEFIEKCEINKESLNINYIIFIKSFIIELVLIINSEGYKDINKFFLNQLLNNIEDIKKKYLSDGISSLIAYVEKLIKNPDSFLCPNAFSILKNASFKKIKPRSRNNSFDKNDLNTNIIINNDIKNNNLNKNEKNSKIDDYFKKKKSESDEEEEEYNKKLSSIISFKNSSQNNNIIKNINFQSQLSLGLNENNSKIKFSSMNSGLSNNTLLAFDFQGQSSNLLNSSKLSGEDSMSKNSLFKPSSFSELFPHDSVLSAAQAGINSRLASQRPILGISKKEKKRKNPAFDKFQKKLGNDTFIRKNHKENLDKILNKEISSIINNKFYNNENVSNDEKNKNTTASETKKNNKKNVLTDDLKSKDKKSNKNEILVSKTPIKLAEKSEENNEIKNNENLQVNGIRKNLGALFNQHAGK